MPELRQTKYAGILLDAIQRRYDANQPKPHAFPTPFRHSDGGDCSRMLAMKAAGIEESDPFDPASVWATWLGEVIHGEWQAACEAQGLDCEAEYKVKDKEEVASGSLDLYDVIAKSPNEKLSVTVEAKSVNGTKFRNAIGVMKRSYHSYRTTPKGPSSGHVIQLALNTCAADSVYGVLFYLSTEALSKQVHAAINQKYKADPMTERDRFVAEWWFTREELQPIADQEIARLKAIKEVADMGLLPPAVAIGDGFTVEHLDPTSEEGWRCIYCTRRSVCLQYPPGVTPIEIGRNT